MYIEYSLNSQDSTAHQVGTVVSTGELNLFTLLSALIQGKSESSILSTIVKFIHFSNLAEQQFKKHQNMALFSYFNHPLWSIMPLCKPTALIVLHVYTPKY